MKRYLALLILVVSAVAYGATTYTTNYNLAKPGDGDTNYGAAVRTNFDTIDTQMKTNADSISDHMSDTEGAHAASAISATVGANICTTSDTVQEYLTCLDGVYDPEVSGVVLTTGDQTIAGVKTFSSAPVFSSVPNTMIRAGSGGTVTATTFTAESPATTKGDLMAHDGTDLIRLPVGTNGDLLTANSAEDSGLEWVSTLPAANGGTGVSSTATFPTSGVVVTEDGTQTLTNKTLGSTNTITGATAANFTVSGSTVTLPTGTTTLVGRGTTDTLTNKSIDGSTNTITNVPLSSGTTGTLAVARGGTGQTSALAAFDALSPNTTKGDITVRDTTNNIRVAVGTNGQVLTADSTTPSGVKWGDSAAGAGEINAISNPSAASATTDWTAGTGHAVTRDTSNSPLAPTISTSLAIAASANDTEDETSGVYNTISTFPTGLRNRKMKVEFWMTTPAADTWAVSVYSGSTRMSLSTDSSGVTSLPAGVTGKFTTTFDADASTSYTVHFTRTAGTGTTTLYVTNVVVGPGIQPQGAVVTEAVSWTPTGNLTTNVTYTGRKWREGDRGFYEVKAAFSGTNTDATTMSINMPAGETIDTAKVVDTTSAVLALGSASIFDASGTAQTLGLVIYNQTTSVRVMVSNASSTYSVGNQVSTSGGVPLTIASGDIITLRWNVPIAEWSGSGTTNLAQNDVEYVSHDGTNIVYGPAGAALLTTTPAGTSESFTITSGFTNIQASDTFTLEIQDGGSGAWMPASAPEIETLQYDGTNFIGIGVRQTGGAVSIIRGKYRRQAGSTSGTWAGITAGTRVRVKKFSGGQAVGFGLASSTQAGLVSTGAQTLAGVKTFSSGINLGNDTLTTYNIASLSTTFTDNGTGSPGTSGSVTIQLQKVGTFVTAYIPSYTVATLGTSPTQIISNTAMAASYRPAVAQRVSACTIQSAGTTQTFPGQYIINTDGTLALRKDATGGGWGATTSGQNGPCTITWYAP